MKWLPKSVVCLRYYDRSRLRSDGFAALQLSLQIFPLAIAVAVASGVHPLYGVSCAAVAGLLTSVFRDSKIRVSAPNVIFVAVASTVVAREGMLGLALSTLLAGVLLMFFAAIRLGKAIQALPRSVAVLVLGEQLQNLLGLSSQVPADQVARRVLPIARHMTEIKPYAIILALAALLLVMACKRIFRYMPAGLMAMAMGTLLVRFGHFPIRTVQELHGASPTLLLHPVGLLRLDLFGTVVASAFAIAVLVAIESLQAMDCATGLTGECSNPDGELFLQGGANLASAVLGSLPVSGVSSHTLENAHLGAQTPVAGILQALFLVAFLLLTAPVLPFIPLPVISALILSSLFTMTAWQEIPRLTKAPRSEVIAWAVIALLTIMTDLSAAVAVGMLIGMFLHLRKLQQPASEKFFVRPTLR
jgi:SulP family sulfate permease